MCIRDSYTVDDQIFTCFSIWNFKFYMRRKSGTTQSYYATILYSCLLYTSFLWFLHYQQEWVVLNFSLWLCSVFLINNRISVPYYLLLFLNFIVRLNFPFYCCMQLYSRSFCMIFGQPIHPHQKCNRGKSFSIMSVQSATLSSACLLYTSRCV